ncbi:MAG: tetratricopeptide repeat protein [Verrucomicrobia bacterium]|nr:tetratricopeptide repeat protein [Verrucomicrobiota bacterium]
MRPDFRDLPFAQLIEQDERLAELRQAYTRRTAEERRKAADWAYHASSANDLFNRALASGGRKSPFPQDWPPGIEALAIDPTFAPALLTVGSLEHQLGRKDEARVMFLTLLKLAKDTPDLEVIIDKAGAFLLEADDFDEARQLYEAACAAFPVSTRLLGGLGYSLAKLGRREEAVAIQRRALALDRDNPDLLNDLGWALTENSQYEEAERVLQRAVTLAPAEDDWPRNNLEEVRRLKKSASPRA